ncbi:hypothetical protein BDK51DRAFT_44932 [Blyttiomyces helicus]|uniref:Uncharacterized protein n=1 Tax=Blyttiomyces helicus TaxID=388810 RepID=A0A4P9WKP9_9FUNG|nr:hypothetical protein BDK51DRAFT_44932 [Blyttiomyces helicus]|eukprot:RKO93579.1 hypothetical protein BDK51DRAFT_44932 [Blyttiomyces helicus]
MTMPDEKPLRDSGEKRGICDAARESGNDLALRESSQLSQVPHESSAGNLAKWQGDSGREAPRLKMALFHYLTPVATRTPRQSQTDPLPGPARHIATRRLGPRPSQAPSYDSLEKPCSSYPDEASSLPPILLPEQRPFSDPSRSTIAQPPSLHHPSPQGQSLPHTLLPDGCRAEAARVCGQLRIWGVGGGG